MQNALELQLSAHGRVTMSGTKCFGWRHRLCLKASAPFPSDSVALIYSLTVATTVCTYVGCSKGTSSLFKPLPLFPKFHSRDWPLSCSVLGTSIRLHQLFIHSVFSAPLLQKYMYFDKSPMLWWQKNVWLSSKPDADRSDIHDPPMQMKVGGSCL